MSDYHSKLRAQMFRLREIEYLLDINDHKFDDHSSDIIDLLVYKIADNLRKTNRSNNQNVDDMRDIISMMLEIIRERLAE